MSSQAQIDASRANGAKSRGPITPEGKLASSRNSLKHGLLAKTVVLDGESKEEFIELLTSYQDEHQPETPTEETLIENMAAARWRQRRVWNMETAGLDQEIRTPRFPDGEDFPTQAYNAFATLTDKQRSFELLSRYEVRHERQFRNSLTSLQKLQAQREAANRPTPTRASAGNGPANVKHTRLYWLGGDDGPVLAADTHPHLPFNGPTPEDASGSLRNPDLPPDTNLFSLCIRAYLWLKMLLLHPLESCTPESAVSGADDSMGVGRSMTRVAPPGRRKTMHTNAIRLLYDGGQ